MTVAPEILTFTGHYFDFLQPQTSHVCIEDIARALSQICRFTGHTRSFYSVAQHAVLVSRIVPPEDAWAGLHHDDAEAYLGDVARPLKLMLPDYRKIEAGVEAAVFAHFGVPFPLPSSVKHADMVMLATERRDLMSPIGDWNLGVEPLADYVIEPMSQRRAEEMFLERYDALQTQRVNAS